MKSSPFFYQGICFLSKKVVERRVGVEPTLRSKSQFLQINHDSKKAEN